MVMLSLRSQKVLLWWAFGGAALYGTAMIFLLDMIPPPTAQWTPMQIAQFYVDHDTEVKVGAVITSWTSAFLVPLAVVLAVQMSRHEQGRAPVWTILGCSGGVLMSIFLVLPPIFWGTAAFAPNRSAEITAALHELGLLTFITTDQYFIFLWVALSVICLVPNSVVHSPYPRWLGYFTAWTAVVIEGGSVAYLTRSGPFAWNGIVPFWLPTFAFFGWIVTVAVLLFKAINAQMRDVDTPPSAAAPA
jgi:hypothetical protein